MFRSLCACLLMLAACGDDSGTPVDAGVSSDSAIDAALPPPEVETSVGTVIGNRRAGYQEYLGIPFAAPPLGDLRFRPPQPLPDGLPGDPFDATERPSACVQSAFGFSTGTEDCLYLNVHTPDPLPDGAPVMVWIHGGAFIFGEGVQTDGGTRGDILAAEHGVVVVSMNYRLGPLGFFATPELSAENGGGSGNAGIADQQLAMTWVREHIASFGGDADNITLFGESAGGLSVCLHLTAPGSAGLFHRAISQSGFCDSVIPELAEAEAVGAALTVTLGCDGADPLSCLRAKTSDEIMEADTGPSGMTALTAARRWWPNVDGQQVPGQLGPLLAAGDFQRVPTIIGWNADEGTLFIQLAEQAGEVVDEAAYQAGLSDLAGETGVALAELQAAYALADYADPGAALAAARGHVSLACPSRRAAALVAQHVDVRVYRFEYLDAPFQLGGDRELGAFHSAEIQYVFGHPATLGRTVHSGDDLVLHGVVSGYWTEYASAGDPGGSTPSVQWPLWDPTGDMHLRLDLTPSVGTGADREACALFEP